MFDMNYIYVPRIPYIFGSNCKNLTVHLANFIPLSEIK